MKNWIRSVTILGTVLGVAGQAAAGVHVRLASSAAQVALGEDFHVVLGVTQAGSLFNSYEAVVAFDPSAVTFVAEPLSSQEGPYMRDACGTTFQSFAAGASQLVIQHSLLCPGTSLGGPGDLYVLHFRAGSAPRSAVFDFASVSFYDGGVAVPVSSSTGATVQIGSPVDVTAGPPNAALAVGVGPNPFGRHTVLRIASPAGLQTVRIYDSRGRLVRDLSSLTVPAGERVLQWDGRDASGTRLPAGVYHVSVEMGSRRIVRSVIPLR